FFDSWYVVQFDVDIWNTMGYHEITPSQSGGGGWTFGPLGPFTEGPTISEWIPSDTTNPLQSHASIVVPSETPGNPYPNNLPQGHLRVLVEATETAPEVWRYNYAVQNYDFTRAVNQVRIPLSNGAQLLDTFFYSPEVDGVIGEDWQVTREDGELVFTAAGGNTLRWFSLYNFEVVTDAVPTNGEVTLIPAQAGSPSDLTVRVLTPGESEGLFSDSFEIAL
ncbi:MAG: hypothetical protein AAGH65_10085, partial [Pseudomonadota bacterium]